MTGQNVRRSVQSLPAEKASAPNPGPAETHPVVSINAPAARASWRLTLLAAGAIVLAGAAAYHNSLAGPFVYDDVGSIVENETIRQLWPVWQVLAPPPSGVTVTGRPLLNLSLAVNYALGGLNVWGYHAVNLAVHITAALLLMSILRRTFLTPVLRDRFGPAALPLALASALVWLLHPLQTESVTYIVQRAESLMGLFYLLTLYCLIRGASGSAGVPPARAHAGETPALHGLREKGDCPPSRCSWLWYTAAVGACLLGMATKEVMVTAPLVALLYDRMFLAGSIREACRRRWGLYLGLAAAWGLLAYLVLSTGLISRQAELGSPDPWSYARTQPGVILYYLRLSVWPGPLCCEYPWSFANTPGEILPGAIVVGLLLAATLRGVMRRKAWGFLGAWFLLILAPTSSILPLTALGHEHRMYLSLAAVVALAVAAAYALCDKFPPRPRVSGRGAIVARWAAPLAVFAAVATALGSATVARNRDYRTVVGLYQDTLDKCPHNADARAMVNRKLAVALASGGRAEEAIERLREVVRLKPDYASAYNNLGVALVACGKTQEAIERFQQALRLKADDAVAHNNLAVALASMARLDEAIPQYREALRLSPAYVQAHFNLGLVLAQQGRVSEAIAQYDQALRLRPDFIAALSNLAWLLATHEPAEGGDAARAIGLAQEARRFAGQENVALLDVLAAAYAAAGRFDDAVMTAERAIQLAESSGQMAFAQQIQSRLELYRAGRPYRQPLHSLGPNSR